MRLVLLFLFTAVMIALSKAEAPELMMSYHLGMGLGGSLVAALFCLPIARFRNLGSFSKAALVFTLMMIASTLPDVTRNAVASQDPWAGTGALVGRKAPLGNLTLRVPESWQFENQTNKAGVPVSVLRAPDASFFVWTSAKGGDFAAGFKSSEYAELMRKLYEESLATSIGPGEPVTLGNTPAMRFAFDGTRDRARVKGYLYTAKGRADFCHLLAFNTPSNFERLQRTVARVIENADVD